MKLTQSFFDEFLSLSRDIYGKKPIPLHRPIFKGNEKKYLIRCIDSNFVSSAGKEVDEFEKKIAKFTNSKFAISTVNGTAALHTALMLLNVKKDDEVITQSATFVATCNAISYLGANPVFVDIDKETLGMSPEALENFLNKNTKFKGNKLLNKFTGKEIKCCLPMHTYGLPCRIQEIKDICKKWKLNLVEDSAESLGSFVKNKHTGTFGQIGTLSFNGNKIITTGGGGMIITDNRNLAKKARHITTTSKIPHPFKFIHDEIGYNYRMPNINAVLGCAQMEKISEFLKAKKRLAKTWKAFFDKYQIKFFTSEPENSANFWLNTIQFESKSDRDRFIKITNQNGVMTRPIWELMSNLKMYKNCFSDHLENTKFISDRIVNIPSSVPNINEDSS
tara:strand:- start:1545 stop:2717 length:1173 start_codon:yes stop_codon:yes gene_type:complete